MSKIDVIAIFDVGKTNKKLLLFDQYYKIVFERSAKFLETVDEDNEACENLVSLKQSVVDALRDVFNDERFNIRAINFTTYGASFVFVNKDGRELTPLYNYLKSYPENLQQKFYNQYGGEANLSLETASPVLGSLNSGMQIFRLKYLQPEIYQQTKFALHLPQYLSYLLSGTACSDITSIGCHTNLWNFQINNYHSWVSEEGLSEKLPPIFPSDGVLPASFEGHKTITGVGLHDSSAALIPYLVSFKEPFALISTGTWGITLNPFNNNPLTAEELKQDCLCYLSYSGKAVKASRIFSGYIHEQQTMRIAKHFKKSNSTYKTVRFDEKIIARLRSREQIDFEIDSKNPTASVFETRDIGQFKHYREAYHQLIMDLVSAQIKSAEIVLKNTLVRRIFVDGGFSKNSIFMNLLALHLPGMEVFAASVAQATGLGAALAIHHHWNTKSFPSDLIELKHYSASTFLTTA